MLEQFRAISKDNVTNTVEEENENTGLEEDLAESQRDLPAQQRYEKAYAKERFYDA